VKNLLEVYMSNRRMKGPVLTKDIKEWPADMDTGLTSDIWTGLMKLSLKTGPMKNGSIYDIRCLSGASLYNGGGEFVRGVLMGKMYSHTPLIRSIKSHDICFGKNYKKV
jgi:hypothetical protein